MTTKTRSCYSKEEVHDFLRQLAKQKGWRITLREGPEIEGDEFEFLRVPVKMGPKDVWQMVNRMQDLEDAWNRARPTRYPRLMLVPSR